MERSSRAIQGAAALPGGIGRKSIALSGETGRIASFFAAALARTVRRPFRGELVVEHMHFIGNRSVGIVLLTGAFTGMVLTLQSVIALRRFGSESFVGPLVSLGLIRELGPVLASLMITSRAGSAIAARLANMRATEQIDALEVMAVDPRQYLVSPRLLASLLVVPMAVAFFILAGIGAGYFFGVSALGIDGSQFLASTRDAVETSDVTGGLAKALVFAAIIVLFSTYRGFHAERSARGVGDATTRAVVEIAALILLGDYILTALLF